MVRLSNPKVAVMKKWEGEDSEADIKRRVTKDGSKDEEVVRQEIKRIQEEESFVPRGGFNI